jgi:HPt (histidine-containing phosphotransfer) domain-containing protein
MSNNNQKFIDEMLVAFLTSIPKGIEEINSFAESQEWDALARAVHKLKPSLTLMGLHSAKEQALLLEELAKQGKNPAVIKSHTKELSAKLNQALIELREIN